MVVGYSKKGPPTPAANLGAYTSQFGSGGLIFYCSRIRKKVKYIQTENRQTENRCKNIEDT